MRVGEKVWYANRIEKANAEITEYDTPVEVVTAFRYFTVMPAVSRGYLEVMKYGEKSTDTWTVIANREHFFDKIKKGDVMWVDYESPVTEHNADLESQYGNGCTANAVVVNVAEVNYTISITLERNQNQVKG